MATEKLQVNSTTVKNLIPSVRELTQRYNDLAAKYDALYNLINSSEGSSLSQLASRVNALSRTTDSLSQKVNNVNYGEYAKVSALTGIYDSITRLNTQISKLSSGKLDNDGVNNINEKIANLQSMVNEAKTNITSLNRSFNDLNTSVDTRFSEVNSRIGRIDSKFLLFATRDQINLRLNDIEDELSKRTLINDFNRMTQDVLNYKADQDELREIVQTIDSNYNIETQKNQKLEDWSEYLFKINKAQFLRLCTITEFLFNYIENNFDIAVNGAAQNISDSTKITENITENDIRTGVLKDTNDSIETCKSLFNLIRTQIYPANIDEVNSSGFMDINYTYLTPIDDSWKTLKFAYLNESIVRNLDIEGLSTYVLEESMEAFTNKVINESKASIYNDLYYNYGLTSDILGDIKNRIYNFDNWMTNTGSRFESTLNSEINSVKSSINSLRTTTQNAIETSNNNISSLNDNWQNERERNQRLETWSEKLYENVKTQTKHLAKAVYNIGNYISDDYRSKLREIGGDIWICALTLVKDYIIIGDKSFTEGMDLVKQVLVDDYGYDNREEHNSSLNDTINEIKNQIKKAINGADPETYHFDVSDMNKVINLIIASDLDVNGTPLNVWIGEKYIIGTDHQSQQASINLSKLDTQLDNIKTYKYYPSYIVSYANSSGFDDININFASKIEDVGIDNLSYDHIEFDGIDNNPIGRTIMMMHNYTNSYINNSYNNACIYARNIAYSYATAWTKATFDGIIANKNWNEIKDDATTTINTGVATGQIH